ncbi:hypothetical protein [Williamsia limnetica]|uniref:hypothetical protein n=1 Tax=Williamsia limnetica TaxID=882452 RepID=UPI0014766E21|nr:hypothetical protein [Williamsia limnetica]
MPCGQTEFDPRALRAFAGLARPAGEGVAHVDPRARTPRAMGARRPGRRPGWACEVSRTSFGGAARSAALVRVGELPGDAALALRRIADGDRRLRAAALTDPYVARPAVDPKMDDPPGCAPVCAVGLPVLARRGLKPW